MYPEEVYDCGLPLPYELLRPIVFQVAYEHIKEKLRFPVYDGARYNTLRIKWKYNTEGRTLHSIYMRWGFHNECYFSVIHVTFDESIGRENRRLYGYHLDSGRVILEINCERGFQY